MHARAIRPRRNITLRGAHGAFHQHNRVGRASWHGGETPIKHRDIVVMIARRKDVFTSNPEQPAELAQRGALVVFGMTETEIHRVPLIVEMRMLTLGLVDELHNLIHFLLRLRDETFRFVTEVKQAGACFSLYERQHFFEYRLGRTKKLRVSLRTPVVPIAKRLPARFPVPRRPENVPLARENKIRMNRKFKIEQPALEKIDRATGIDGPNHAIILPPADEFHAVGVKHRMFFVAHERAVEVGADQFYFPRHEASNLEIDFIHATGNGFPE